MVHQIIVILNPSYRCFKIKPPPVKTSCKNIKNCIPVQSLKLVLASLVVNNLKFLKNHFKQDFLIVNKVLSLNIM